LLESVCGRETASETKETEMTMHELARELAGKAATKVGETVTLIFKDGTKTEVLLKSVVGVRLLVKVDKPDSWVKSGPVTAYDLAAIY